MNYVNGVPIREIPNNYITGHFVFYNMNIFSLRFLILFFLLFLLIFVFYFINKKRKVKIKNDK